MLLSITLLAGALPAADAFIEKPYLQLGPDSTQGLALMWQSAPGTGPWTVEVASAKTPTKFRKLDEKMLSSRDIRVRGIAPHTVFTARIPGAWVSTAFQYRIGLAGQTVFQAAGKPRPGPKEPYTFIAFGDTGADKTEQRAIAAQSLKLAPSMIFHTGDIVYSRGLISEYRKNHFPIYNSDTTPLTRSVTMIAAAGNHDTATRDLAKHPDALPYFYYWSMPLNGPEMEMFAKLEGDAPRIADFKSAAGSSFPRMLNYSFDWGNAHWLVLDSNHYADWSDAAFQRWVANDLAASKATWKFVGLHHPGFSSSKAHFKDQQARLLAPIFERHGVDVVFSGHVHNYQRSYPMRFSPTKYDIQRSKEVNGKWRLDREYDGASKAKPDGVIYLVTGAGGNTLYNPEQEGDPRSWQEFTAKFTSKIHSLTHVEINGNTAHFRQLDVNGNEIDRFSIRK